MTNDEGETTVNYQRTAEPWEGEAGSDWVREEPLGERSAPVYDLEERTARFGEAVVDFLKQVPLGPRTNRLVDQLTGCGTSTGANYCEADDAVSHKEFVKIIGTCRKEASEAKFFLRMIARACPDLAPGIRPLWQEVREIHLIFSKIRPTAQQAASPK